MKKCTKCGETKPLDEFNKSSQAKDGRNPRCRACKAEDRLREDPEKARRARARWMDQNREHVRARQRAYDEAHKDRLQERRKELRDLNGEHIRAQEKARRDRNPHLGWIKRYRRRARKYGFDVVIETFTKPDVIGRYGDSCFYCETSAFEELDHYVPVSEGGPHTLDNVRPSCAKCNKARRYATGADDLTS